MSAPSGNIGRYFLHGIIFSILRSVVTIGWAFIFAFLVIAGLFLGLIIGLALLFLFMGAINSFVTDAVWKVDMKSAWSDYLVHGFVLFIVLAIVSFPVNFVSSLIAPTYDLTSLIIKTIAMTIIMAFIDGYIARTVAESFRM